MTTSTHPEFVELAAASIDFDLGPAEAQSLAAHLEGCQPCRRTIAGLRGDQVTIERLPRYELRPASVDRIGSRVTSRRGPRLSGIRLVAVAAAIALLALGSLAVGAALLERATDPDLSVVTPSVVTAVEPTATPSASTAPSTPPSTPPGPGPTGTDIFAAGSTVAVVVDGLRVRTAPTVDNTKSAKLDPLLEKGVELEIVEGPVYADDYEWYLVQAIGMPHRGWIAIADHDGQAWVKDQTAATATAPAFTAEEAALVTRLRADARSHCAPRRYDLPAAAMAGVECLIDSSAPASRLGIYQLPDAGEAARRYLERMASYGVGPSTGDCPNGLAGDAAWMAGDGRPGPDAISLTPDGPGPWAVGRSGCFLDENGTANARATCGSLYVGTVGRDANIAAIYDWLWRSDDGPRADGEPPGICAAG